MNFASASAIHVLRPRIIDKRERLQAATRSISPAYLAGLLAEIDAALQKIDKGDYGLCETCRDPIEPDRLESDPLTRFCLDHLTSQERRAHEQDLALAQQIQSGLLPARDIAAGEWETHYRYEPAGIVGGDYCEVIASAGGDSLFFALGDVAGKGVAASLLMTHLSAIFRSLLTLDLPLTDVVSRANRLFCESTPVTHYATLVAGRTTKEGVELCNAGHCRPLLLGRGRMERIDISGLPLGLFHEGGHTASRFRIDPGQSIVLYSDGITEAQDPGGNAYEEEQLMRSLQTYPETDCTGIANRVLHDVARFRDTTPPNDDMTLLIIRRRA